DAVARPPERRVRERTGRSVREAPPEGGAERPRGADNARDPPHHRPRAHRGRGEGGRGVHRAPEGEAQARRPEGADAVRAFVPQRQRVRVSGLTVPVTMRTEGTTMTVPVWVEQENGKFTATVLGAPQVKAEGA